MIPILFYTHGEEREEYGMRGDKMEWNDGGG